MQTPQQPNPGDGDRNFASPHGFHGGVEYIRQVQVVVYERDAGRLTGDEANQRLRDLWSGYFGG